MPTAAGSVRAGGAGARDVGVARPGEAAAAYRVTARRRSLLLLGLTAALLFAVAFDISWGPARLSLMEVVRSLVSPESVSARTNVIVWDIRTPVALMAVVVGASLAVAGAEMQTILNNPLASPFTLGISAAASFGAALGLVLGVHVFPALGPFLITGNAFVFAMLASVFVYLFSRARGVSTESMVLVGIALVFLFSSLLALLQYVAAEQALQQIVFWTMGSLSRASWGTVGIASALLLACQRGMFHWRTADEDLERVESLLRELEVPRVAVPERAERRAASSGLDRPGAGA